jgi:hypothetical protein
MLYIKQVARRKLLYFSIHSSPRLQSLLLESFTMRLPPTLAIFSSLFLRALSLPTAQGPINLSCDQNPDSFIASLRAPQPALQESLLLPMQPSNLNLPLWTSKQP